jgi:hypothetical protein
VLEMALGMAGTGNCALLNIISTKVIYLKIEELSNVFTIKNGNV